MSSIELVLYTPLIMLMTFLVVQLALAFLGNQVASAAAREGARVARAQGGTPAALAAGTQKADVMLRSVGAGLLTRTTVTVTSDGQQVRAVVRGQPMHPIPFVAFGVQQVVEGPVERFRPDDGTQP